jgi:hypothetical protein
MASENTITELILRTIQPESDITHSFFGSLAREIRDMIYDLIFQEKEHPISSKNSSRSAHYCKTRTTLPKVRLTSRQFKLEYDERDKYHLPKNYFRASPLCYGFSLNVPTLAVRTTILHLDRECCKMTQNPKSCLVPGNGWTKGIGGSDWSRRGRFFAYNIAELPLLEKAYVHVSCGAMKRAVDPLPAGNPSAKIPKLAQISTFQTAYIRDPSQDDSVQSDEQEPRSASASQSGGFLVLWQTKATWTYVDGWENEARSEKVRMVEFKFGSFGKGLVYF